MTGLCLYAVLREAPGDLGAAPGGGPLRAVAAAGLVAVVAERDGPPGLSVPALEEHDATVRRLAESASALLPARFGGWLPDERALAGWIAERRRSFEEALTLVEGCVQMTLRVFGPAAVAETGEPLELSKPSELSELSKPSAGSAEGPSPLGGGGLEKRGGQEGGGLDQSGPGTRYLAGRLEAHRRAGSLPEAAGLLDALRPLVRAERIRRHDAGPLVATAHHLVERGAVSPYLEVIGASGVGGGYRVTASGPWPPYAFSEEPS